MKPIDADALIELFESNKASLVGNTEFGKGMIAALSIDIKVVKDSPTIEQPKWISCEERLPNAHTDVLVFDGLAVDIGTLTLLGEWESMAIANITHWMPLPQPPKGVE